MPSRRISRGGGPQAGHRRAVRWIAAAGLAAAVLLTCLPSHAADPLVGRPAPNFSRFDLGHQRVSLAAYRGKVVLLNFWATWCGPCRIEIPRFMEWQKRYGGAGLQVVGVSMDDSEGPVRQFAAGLKVNYPIVMGDPRLGELYGGVLGVPVTFLIDRRGVIRARFDGGTITVPRAGGAAGSDLSEMQREMRNLLGASAR